MSKIKDRNLELTEILVNALLNDSSNLFKKIIFEQNLKLKKNSNKYLLKYGYLKNK